MFFPPAQSAEQLRQLVIDENPGITPIPSVETIRRTFQPKSVNSTTSDYHTGRFNVKYAVQSRNVRKENKDAHYVNKEWKFAKLQEEEWRKDLQKYNSGKNAENQNKTTNRMISTDDKHMIGIGEGEPLEPGNRQRSGIVFDSLNQHFNQNRNSDDNQRNEIAIEEENQPQNKIENQEENLNQNQIIDEEETEEEVEDEEKTEEEAEDEEETEEEVEENQQGAAEPLFSRAADHNTSKKMKLIPTGFLDINLQGDNYHCGQVYFNLHDHITDPSTKANPI